MVVCRKPIRIEEVHVALIGVGLQRYINAPSPID